jgi:serpin B
MPLPSNRKNRRLNLIMTLLLTIFCHPSMATATESNDLQELARSTNRFALDLYGRMRSDAGNLFFSPYSIATALAMTYAGARGNTAKQMATVLYLPSDQEQVDAAFAQLQDQLNAIQGQGNVELNLANGLWAQQNHPFLATYLDRVNKSYRAALRQADFETAYETVRQDINAWVEEQTHDKITDLLKPGILDALTRLVLVNAIYFKGRWANPFEESATRQTEFAVDAESTVTVPMMTQQETFGYMENDILQALELPYEGGALSMVVLLPKQPQGLAELENALSAENLAQWLDVLHSQEVEVYLPRFTLTAEFNLSTMLASMGMADAFSRAVADFSALDGSRDLFISSVVHKAFIDVNEEGTEAAAATGAVISLTSLPAPPVVFRADHPFVFLIREQQTGAVLFIGRAADPRPR